MEQEVSIWLVPAEGDRTQLSQSIQRLAAQYDAVTFEPHLTLAGHVTLKRDQLQTSLGQLVQSTPPLQLKTKGIDHSAVFFRTVFIQTDLAPQLLRLRQQVYACWPPRPTQPYHPHISLIYQELDAQTRAEIAASLAVQDRYLFDRIAVVYPDNAAHSWRDVPSWKTLGQWPLSGY